MKKLIYSALAMAFAFFAASCQQENLEPVAEANTVTYTVKVPGAMSTKAVSDGIAAVDKVYYEVYRAGEVTVPDADPVYEGSKPVSNGQASFELDFVKNQNFVVLFWAQNSTLDMYNTADLRKVQLVKPGNANNAAAQVFAGSNVVEDCVPADGGNVELVRPISQLNIATNAESLQFGTKNINLVSSTVSVSGLYPLYNVYTKAVSENDTPLVFNVEGAVPTKLVEGESVNETLVVGGETYTYVAMNYVGFTPEDGVTVDVDFTIKTSEGGVTHSVSSVPVKPNYRTNIVGNLLTEAADYDVTLDAAWEDEEYTKVVVSTAVDLQTEVNNILDGETGEITLAGDIDFGDLVGSLTRATSAPASLIIPAEKTVVLNLNGYTLSQTAGYAGHSMIVNNGTLTLTGEGTIRYTYNGTPDSLYGKGNQTISNFGTLVLNGPTVENATEKMSHALFAIDTREGATFNVVDGAVLCANATAVRMGQFGADANEMTVEGGRIYGGRAVQMHLPSSSATINPRMALDVQGGVLESNDETYNIGIYVLSNGQSAENVTVEIGGEAHIKGSVLVNAAATDSMNDAAIQITGGTIDGIYGVYSYSTDAAKADAVISVTGGAFAVKPNYVDPAYEAKEQDGKYVVVAKPEVAKIGETGYWSLNAAVAAVKDGETISLVADEIFTETNRCNNGGWWDGLAYSGDKSFTIDLGGYTIKQDGSLNDYLVWIKNDGAKANTITFKNGTMDAGTTAFCALATASSNAQKMTVNLEDINLINNNSNGAVVKARGGSELNVKAGTKIIGKNSYLGVENWKAVVNIYDGAEIYMNGTSSYNGCLVGVGGNGTINVYGGYGKGVRGGFIAMTSGGTINVAGGEWIANTDGTVGNNSNLYVLTAQSNKYESGFAGPSIINVTGGTLRGGMDAWVLNNLPEEKAELNISGGNFNANPSAYVVSGYKAVDNNGTWNIEDVKVYTEAALKAAMIEGNDVILGADVVLTEAWTPVGTSENPFNGIFNGNNHKITGLKVSDTDYAAFIAYVGKDAQIKNLTLENVDINSTKHAAGVVCIASEGVTLENVTVSGEIEAPSYAGGLLHNAANAVVKNCVNNANVIANRAGGIASWVTVNAMLENVENNGDITGAVGASGIAHGFAGTIKNAVNNGDVTSNNFEAAAGIAGVQKAASTYEYCYNYGAIKSTYDDANASAAGILGQSAGSASTLKYCANYGTVTAEQSYAAGIAYSLYGTINASYCYNAGTIAGADGAGAIAPKAQFGTGDKASYCLNAGVVSSANGTVYQGSNNNTSCYYYNASDLLNVSNNAAVAEADALAVLNGGSDKSFFTTEGGKIVVKK